MIDEKKYEGRTLGHWSVTSIRDGSIPWNTADEELCADAPLLLEEVKRLRKENKTLWKGLMLAESALGEVRAYHENGQGELGEILEHYRDKEGVEMPNAFDEVIE